MSENMPDCVARWGMYFPQGEDPDREGDVLGYGMTDEELDLFFDGALMWWRCREAGEEPPIDAATGLRNPERFITRGPDGKIRHIGDDPDVGDEE